MNPLLLGLLVVGLGGLTLYSPRLGILAAAAAVAYGAARLLGG